MTKNQSINQNVIISFGVFDGVHIGHQALIRRMLDRSNEIGLETVILTFEPHPALSTLGKAPPIITTLQKKIELLKQYGIDRIVVEDFNEQFSQLSPEEFVRDVLIGGFHAQDIIVGYDCAFGKGRAGDKNLLKKLGEKYKALVEIIEPFDFDGEIVSSTRVRNAIQNGELELTNRLLNRPYSIIGTVVKGKGIGHKIGYATANIDTQNEVLPPPGVYAVKARLDDQVHNGIMNMGNQPTFGEGKFRIEVHLLDFTGNDLYGRNIEIFFIKNLRKEEAFPSTNELKEQIKKDELMARQILEDTKI